MKEILYLVLVVGVAITVTSIFTAGPKEEFERTERIEQVVENLQIQKALERSRMMYHD
jgi:hypothetical protein